nr:solute carrier family 22 member 9-like [Chrysemys picta bellii]
MSFPELLDHIGGMGRFQVMHVAFLAIPLLMLASHNLLQNFTAEIPEHHCQVSILANYTHHANLTANLPAEDLFWVSIPMDRSQKPEKCQRFVTTQWQLLNPNATSTNTIELDIETCVDGWTYDKSLFTDTIITEWDLVCESRTLRQMVQSLYMAGVQVWLESPPDLVLPANGGNRHLCCFLPQLHHILRLPLPHRPGHFRHLGQFCLAV